MVDQIKDFFVDNFPGQVDYEMLDEFSDEELISAYEYIIEMMGRGGGDVDLNIAGHKLATTHLEDSGAVQNQIGKINLEASVEDAPSGKIDPKDIYGGKQGDLYSAAYSQGKGASGSPYESGRATVGGYDVVSGKKKKEKERTVGMVESDAYKQKDDKNGYENAYQIAGEGEEGEDKTRTVGMVESY